MQQYSVNKRNLSTVELSSSPGKHLLVHIVEQLPLAVSVHPHVNGEDKVPVPVVGVNTVVLPPVGHSVLGLLVGAGELLAILCYDDVLRCGGKDNLVSVVFTDGK